MRLISIRALTVTQILRAGSILVLCACSFGHSVDENSSGSRPYALGPGDEIALYVSNVAELSGAHTYRLDPQGFIDVPLVGPLRLSGLTLSESRGVIVQRLKDYVYEPQVSVDIQAFRSQPVTVLGAVNEPGVHQIEGRKSVLEVLSLAKGLRADAGDSLHITRKVESGKIPLPTSRIDETGRFYTADISLRSFLNGQNPSGNIEVRSDDVLSIPTADLVYVIGAVNKPGGFVLDGRKSVSVLQALSVAGGLTRDASASNCRILRSDGQSKPQQVPLNVKQILEGKKDDLTLRGNDILFIPNSSSKGVMGKIAEAALQAATGAAVYRPW
jgi:polysaccharide export outer membrane protein